MANVNPISKPFNLSMILCLAALNWGASRLPYLLTWDNLFLSHLRIGLMKLYRCLSIVSISGMLMTQALAQDQKPYTVNDLTFIALESSPQVLAARDQSKAV